MAKIYNFTNKKYEEIPYHIRNNSGSGADSGV